MLIPTLLGELAHVIAINLRREYKWMVHGKSNKAGSKRPVSLPVPDSPERS